MRKPGPRLAIPTRRPQPRLPSPYRPDPRPHIVRTVAVMVATVAGAAGAVLAVQATTPVHVQMPVQTTSTYDPGLYTPEPRNTARPARCSCRPQHPASVYTPGGTR